MEISGVQPAGSKPRKRTALIVGGVGLGVVALVAMSLLGGSRFLGAVHAREYPSGVCSLALSPDGQLLAVGYNTGHLDLHDAGSGARLRTLDDGGPTIGNWLSAVAFNRDGTVLASGNWDSRLRFWDPHTGEAARPTVKHTYRVMALAWDPFDPSGKRLAFGGAGVHVVDTSSGEVTPAGGGGMVRAIGYTPSGDTLASIGERTWAVLWNPETAEERLRLEGDEDHDNQTVTLAMRPDGQQVATATGATIELWDATTGSLERSLAGHPGAEGLLCLAYSPDGSLLASSGDRRSRGVRLWNVGSGELLDEQEALDVDGDPAVVWALVFTRDGRLIAGHRDGFTAWDVGDVPGP